MQALTKVQWTWCQQYPQLFTVHGSGADAVISLVQRTSAAAASATAPKPSAAAAAAPSSASTPVAALSEQQMIAVLREIVAAGGGNALRATSVGDAIRKRFQMTFQQLNAKRLKMQPWCQQYPHLFIVNGSGADAVVSLVQSTSAAAALASTSATALQ